MTKPTMASEHNPPAGEAMTMRDYFAAAAMQGWIASVGNNPIDPGFMAQSVYLIADAMLKERSR